MKIQLDSISIYFTLEKYYLLDYITAFCKRPSIILIRKVDEVHIYRQGKYYLSVVHDLARMNSVQHSGLLTVSHSDFSCGFSLFSNGDTCSGSVKNMINFPVKLFCFNVCALTLSVSDRKVTNGSRNSSTNTKTNTESTCTIQTIIGDPSHISSIISIYLVLG